MANYLNGLHFCPLYVNIESFEILGRLFTLSIHQNQRVRHSLFRPVSQKTKQEYFFSDLIDIYRYEFSKVAENNQKQQIQVLL
jgi:hypothetical protein